MEVRTSFWRFWEVLRMPYAGSGFFLATLIFHIPERLAGHWHSAPAGVNRHDSVLLWDRTFKGHITIWINSSAHIRSSRRDTTPRWLMDAGRWNDDHNR